MTSNVKLRSNVYLRLPVHVREDPAYRSNVRGRGALRKLLDKIEIFDTQDRAGRWLTPYQAQEWAESTRCAACETSFIHHDGVPVLLPRRLRSVRLKLEEAMPEESPS